MLLIKNLICNQKKDIIIYLVPKPESKIKIL